MPNIEKPNQHFDVVTYTGNGKAVTVNGNAQISTAQSKFGGSSAFFDGTGDYLNFSGESDFAFGTDDFTIEMWLRINNSITSSTLFEGRPTVNGLYPLIWISSDGKVQYYVNGATVILGSTVLATNTWYHIAVSRASNLTRLFINGLQEGATYSDSNNYIIAANRPRIGANNATTPASFVTGYIDDLRVYKGVGKYVSNFTAPTGALAIGPTDPNWQYCVLAMPMDGTNGSTTFPTFAYNASTDLGLNFKPDLVWIKSRSAATDHELYDSVRGIQKELSPNLTNIEVTQFAGLSAFNSNGFTVGNSANVNTNAATYVAWCWKAGDSNSTNTAGSVTSTVSVNTTAGFSAATFNVPSTGAFTVGHGLGVAPKFVIVKNSSASNSWNVYAWPVSTNTSQYLTLHTDAALATISGIWGAALPTSTTVGMTAGTTLVASQAAVMYSWAEIPGFSSFGSYTGNGNANGPFVNLGFRPALLMIKCTTAINSWIILDDRRSGYNIDNDSLSSNSTNSDNINDFADLLSNGFKLRTTGGATNANTATYFYAAWAENPFNYALAR